MMNPHLVNLETYIESRRGSTTVIEGLEFEVKRVFFIYNVPTDAMRGGHAHKTCHQLLVAVCGVVLVTMGDGEKFILDCPEVGLYVPPKHIVRMEFVVENTTLLVLASKKYDPKDYVYNADQIP